VLVILWQCDSPAIVLMFVPVVDHAIVVDADVIVHSDIVYFLQIDSWFKRCSLLSARSAVDDNSGSTRVTFPVCHG